MSKCVSLLEATLFILLLTFVSMPAAKPAARIECVAGGSAGGMGGPAKGARLMEPFAVAFDKQGNWYICEYGGHRITRVDRKGIITLFAGKEEAPDHKPAARISFNQPHGLVIANDQIYVADMLNHRVVKIDLKTNSTGVIAGTGQPGYSGDGGPASNAAFNELYAVDINRSGDKLYLTDLRNHRIRLLNLKSGVVDTIAGNGESGVPKDGGDARSSPLVDPRATAVDSKGNLYILERRGNALRMVDKKGKIWTLIGPANTSDPPRSNHGVEKELNGPKHLCVDLRDNVIIADSENHLIRKYNPTDRTTVVIAGTGEKGDRLVPDDPLKTQLNRPHGVFVHPSGALYVSDSDNNRILKMKNW